MNTKRVLLSIEQPLYKQLFAYELERSHEVEVVAQSCNPIECLKDIARYKPHIWICSWNDGPDTKALLSHAYEIAPEMVIVRVDPDEAVGYLQMQVSSFPDLVSIACRCQREMESVYSLHQ